MKRSEDSDTVLDIADHFGVSQQEVRRWIRSGAPLDLKDADMEELQRWLATGAKNKEERAGNTTVESDAQDTSSVLSKEQAECRKLREEALKLRAESIRLVREASNLRLRWYQKPAFWMAAIPASFAAATALVGVFFWYLNARDEIRKFKSEKERISLTAEIGNLTAEIGNLEEYKTTTELLVQMGGRLLLRYDDGVPAYHVEFIAQGPTGYAKQLQGVSEHLGKLRHVRSITIDVGLYPSASRSFFAELTGKLPHLAEVKVQGENHKWTTEALSPLQDAIHLRTLTLRVTSEVDLSPISKLRQLDEVNLSGATIADDSLVELRSLPNLKSLDLSYTDISTWGVKHLDNLEYLEKLSLKETKVDNSVVDHLANFHRLESLDLAGNRNLDHSILDKINGKRFPSLVFLDLRETDVDTARIEAFVEKTDLPVAYDNGQRETGHN